MGALALGRPTLYTPKIAEEICTHIAGGNSLRSICARPDMPNHSTVLFWVVDNKHDFFDQYARAREAAGFAHADEALALRHELRSGELDPRAARVMLDALKWGAERMAPRAHSPRQEVESKSDHTITLIDAPDVDA